MPNLLYFSSDDDRNNSRARPPIAMKSHKHRDSVFNRTLHSFNSWLKRKEEEGQSGNWHPPSPNLRTDKEKEKEREKEKEKENQKEKDKSEKRHDHALRPSSRALDKRPTRQVIPGLPRPITFRRQNSEKREKLCPHEPPPEEKRALSVDRRAALTKRRTLSPPVRSMSRYSMSDFPDQVLKEHDREVEPTATQSVDVLGPPREGFFERADEGVLDTPVSIAPPPVLATPEIVEPEPSDQFDDHIIQQELDARWILNLSMHFRDQSPREKFFITYAETPTRWRRVTVSVDYRNKPSDSLEADLKNMRYQRDKSARIYESIRDSLPDIQFYPTVTNLKLETQDGRLHVHVTEDVNEIIPYPSASVLRHLETKQFKENIVKFESHISGFVYKVTCEGKTYIKKEIPGPESVDEFLYEINALSSLQFSHHVVKFEGYIVDDDDLIKGLLISFAEQGALVDLIYDWKNSAELPWKRRERWAKQIVEGLSEIHEAAFVQGDFTLSNIVVDGNDDVKIIDINRRGCPVGWEPPELAKIIRSGQRIGMYIGVKSDIYQLGMVLWALAEQQDEPERADQPLQLSANVPEYYRRVVESCLSDNSRDRRAAKELLKEFPEISKEHARPLRGSRNSLLSRRSGTEYIDPATAVNREDIERMLRQGNGLRTGLSTTNFALANDVASTTYQSDADSSSAAYIVGARGRSPVPYNTTELTEYSQSEASFDYAEDANGNRMALPPRPQGDNRASFRDHMLQHRRSNDSLLANLEREVNNNSTPQVSRQNTRDFCGPTHQDSGFADGLVHSIESVDLTQDDSTPRLHGSDDETRRTSRVVEEARRILREDYATV